MRRSESVRNSDDVRLATDVIGVRMTAGGRVQVRVSRLERESQ